MTSVHPKLTVCNRDVNVWNETCVAVYKITRPKLGVKDTHDGHEVTQGIKCLSRGQKKEKMKCSLVLIRRDHCIVPHV